MRKIALDTEAGQVSAELARYGISARARVHVMVEVLDDEAAALPMAAFAQAGGAFGWLGDEPDLYSDADVVRRIDRLFAFGSIVLARFPFTDLSGDKRRPALVVSRDNQRRADLVVCFITSLPREGTDMAPIAASTDTGLKVPSVVCFDKLATLDLAVITGTLGDAPVAWLDAHGATFFGVFGFRSP